MDRVTLNPLKSIKFHEYASNNKQNTFHWEKFLRKESRRLILDEDGKSTVRCMIISDHTAASMQPGILSDVSYCVPTAVITFRERTRVSIVYFSREGRFITWSNKVLAPYLIARVAAAAIVSLFAFHQTKYPVPVAL